MRLDRQGEPGGLSADGVSIDRMPTLPQQRVVPLTRLRTRYETLSSVVSESLDTCKRLVEDVTPLRDEFIDAVRAWSNGYDLRDEPFYPKERGAPRDAGTAIVTNLLRVGPISVASSTPYTFRYVDREVSQRRTPRGRFSDGTPATKSGLGGIDYVGIVEGSSCIPVLGEIKLENDKEPFYALIQLLTYLTELSSEAQTHRASRFLFEGRLPCPVKWDLHILLADFNDRGERSPFITATRDLAAGFKEAITGRPESALLGRVWCLRMETKSFKGALDVVWVV